MHESARWRTLALLSLALIPGMAAWFSASAVIPQLRLEWQLSPSAAAWMTIAVQLGFALGAIVSSAFNISDVFPIRRVILFSAICAALSNWLLSTASGATAGIALRFATGFFYAGIYPPAMKLISTWFRAGRGLALGILIGALTVGNGMPHLINGLGGLDWRLVIHVTSLLSLLGGLIVLGGVTEGPYPFPSARWDPSQVWRVFANRGVRLAAFGYFGHMWELFAMYAWFIVFLREFLAARGAQAGPETAYAAFAVVAIGGVGSWLSGLLADRWGRTRTTALLLIISGACSLGIGFFYHASPVLLLGVALIWGFSVVADSAQYSAMVTELADQSYVGTALTLQTALGFALTVVTIWLIPLIAERIGWQWVFVLLAPGPALGVLAMLRLKSLPESARLAGGRG